MNPALAAPRGPGLSGTALKRIACLSMLLDHIGASLLENGLFKQGAFWPGDVQLDENGSQTQFWLLGGQRHLALP